MSEEGQPAPVKSKDFFLGGRATFTLSVPAEWRQANPKCRDRYTFKVVKRTSEQWGESYFVNLLSGPDNLTDYQPLGKLNPTTGAVRLVKVTKLTDESWPVKLIRRVFARAWADEISMIWNAGFELRHMGKCARCSRPLTVPESIDTGFGATCAAKLGIPWVKAS